MRRNAYLSPTVLALLVLASPCARAAGTDEVTETFNSLYGADLARVRGTGDGRDDVELAVRLLAAAKRAADQPAFLTVLCEKAYDLALRRPTGYGTALEAVDLLARTVPEKAPDCAARTFEIREMQYDAAQGDEKKAAGELLLGSLLPVIEAKEKAGDLAEAAALYRKARAIAAATGSPRADEIDARALAFAQQMKTAARIADVKALLARDPANVSAREGLVRIHLIDLDDPAEAVKHLKGAKDEALLKYVPAAAKGVEVPPEFACLELGEWYRDLAGKAPAHAKAAMYARAKAYLERFLTMHTPKDLSRTRATLALEKVEEAVAKLTAPPTPTRRPKAAPSAQWLDLLVLADPAKDTVNGTWQRQDSGLAITIPLFAGAIMLPVVPTGSYELHVRFVRLTGDDTVAVFLPAGGARTGLLLSARHGELASLGLRNVDGPQVKPARLVNGREYSLRIKVLLEGGQADIAVILDGKPYMDWRGPVSALAVHHSWRLPQSACFGLGVNNSHVVFRSVRLRMLSGNARPLRPAVGRAERGRPPTGWPRVSPLTFAKTPLAGGTGGGPFEDWPKEPGYLVGLRYTTGQLGPHTIIKSLQPIFRTSAGEQTGRVHGDAAGPAQTVVASPGYGVGALTLRTGDRVDGFKITFMRVEEARLDPADAYESPWTGGKRGEMRLGGSGHLIIGIHGRCGADLDAIGLIEGRP